MTSRAEQISRETSVTYGRAVSARCLRYLCLMAVFTLSACASLAEESRAPAGAQASPASDPSAAVAEAPRAAPATESAAVVLTAAPSSPSALPSPTLVATPRPLTPAASTSAPPSSAAPTAGPVQSPSGTPAQTRVPNSSAIPSPQGLPANDGCLTYGAQPPYISFVDCVVHGLPPNAPVTLTADGEVVFLRVGRTDVYPDGSWYFAWSETAHKEIVFVVTAGGVSRTITQAFRWAAGSTRRTPCGRGGTRTLTLFRA